jgi:hypothetical protein
MTSQLNQMTVLANTHEQTDNGEAVIMLGVSTGPFRIPLSAITSVGNLIATQVKTGIGVRSSFKRE